MSDTETGRAETRDAEAKDTETNEGTAVCRLTPAESPGAALVRDPALTGPRAECVLCCEPTELPADHPGSTLCPVCAWQQAQRIACSG